MEREKESNLDKVADAFAGMLRDIFAGLGKHKDEEKVLGHLGYNLGRWIYLADAYHDRQRDARKGAYNPFLCRYGKDAAEQSGGGDGGNGGLQPEQLAPCSLRGL